MGRGLMVLATVTATVGVAIVLLQRSEPAEPWPSSDDLELRRTRTGWLQPVDPSPEQISPLPREPEAASEEVARRLAVRDCGEARYESIVSGEGGRYLVPSCNGPSTTEDGSALINRGSYVQVEATPVVYEGGNQVCIVNVEARTTAELCLADRWYRRAAFSE